MPFFVFYILCVVFVYGFLAVNWFSEEFNDEVEMDKTLFVIVAAMGIIPFINAFIALITFIFVAIGVGRMLLRNKWPDHMKD